MKYLQQDKTFYAFGTPITVALDENGETHVYSTETGEKLSNSDLKFGRVFGGGMDCEVENTDVLMKSGFLYLLAGGGSGGQVKYTVNIHLEGGMIGGYLYGGGIDDKVEHVCVKVSGGAIKWGFFGCGESIECGDVHIVFTDIICTNVYTGGRNPSMVIRGETYVEMLDGHVLDFTIGPGKHKCNACVRVSGGILEKQFIKKMDGILKLELYENIFIPNGIGGSFPVIPEAAMVSWLPPREREPIEDLTGDDALFFDKTSDEGNLTFRFFELRNPNVPRSAAPYPSDFVGDSIFVTFPNGKHMLIDTGRAYSYGEVCGGLCKLGVENIDIFVITHPHGDHMGNAAALLDKFKVSQLWIPDIEMQPALAEVLGDYFDLLEQAERQGVKILRVAEGDHFYFDQTDIFVLNPIRAGEPAKELNENSVAFKVTYKENSALLCADITDDSEKRIAEQYGDKLKCSMMKVAHHGIVYQSYYKFIDRCKPDFMVVHSLRENGVFLKTTRYSLKHVNGFDIDKLYATGRYGKIKVTMDGSKDGVNIVTQY